MDQEKRIDSLTGIRGLAALLVVYDHLGEKGFFVGSGLHLGEIGVMVFFTLSGFLMAFLYGDKDPSRRAISRYAISRFARIAPAYLTIVIFSYFIYSLIDPHFVYSIDNSNLLRHLLFSGNVSALWSIPPEVQFYAIFIGLWMSLHALRIKGNAALLIVALALVVVLVTYRAQLPGTFVGSKIHYFFSGVLLGLVRSQVTATTGMTALTCVQAAAAALVLLVFSGVITLELGTARELYLDLETAGFAGLFVFLFSFDTRLSTLLLGNRIIRICGDCSFSMYLLNVPLIYVALSLLGNRPLQPMLALPVLLAIVAAAWLMYRLLEVPANTLLRRLGTRLLRQPPATLAVHAPAIAATSIPVADPLH
ncbi:acyltransferase family protein [Xanthomonas pisi]|uniref:Acyltransferase n=1 Tax=Xanthomonas pisi TaxID=56457 RepID=A0A2S7D803_9XANT|nr:acyltransferase [Xanthomonas pisi]KLD70209.1 acyltransferase [Xanthomonas pisi DSM 18956]PPU69879.1 acyltransferase [Xanthomonas pisi]